MAGRVLEFPEMKPLIEKLDKSLQQILRSKKTFTVHDIVTMDIFEFAKGYDPALYRSADDLADWLSKLSYGRVRLAKNKGKIWRVWNLRTMRWEKIGMSTIYWTSNTDPDIVDDEFKRFVPHHITGKALDRYIQSPVRKSEAAELVPTIKDEPIQAPTRVPCQTPGVDWKSIAIASLEVTKTLMLQLEALTQE